MNSAQSSSVVEPFSSRRLERIFDATFASYNTRLLGGYDEPVYLPATEQQPTHRLCYREDFFASALHEIAHWCIAGEARRAQVDFGYWYAPDGRDKQTQQEFECAEVKPQTLEWYFSVACNYRFVVSVDNLSQTKDIPAQTLSFEKGLVAQAQRWVGEGFPARATLFFDALSSEFGRSCSVSSDAFTLAALR